MRRSGMDLTKYTKNQKNQNQLFRSADLILILILFLCGFAAFAFVKLYEKPGSYVRVNVDGQVFGEFPLDEDREILISPEFVGELMTDVHPVPNDGDTISENDHPETKEDHEETSWSNVLVIKDGEAAIVEADCRDKICVAHKPVKKIGETIICLPHKVVVEVYDFAEDEDVDAVVR